MRVKSEVNNNFAIDASEVWTKPKIEAYEPQSTRAAQEEASVWWTNNLDNITELLKTDSNSSFAQFLIFRLQPK